MNCTTTKQAEQPKIEGVSDTADIMIKLWKRTADRLSVSELEWFADSINRVDFEVLKLECVTENLWCVFNEQSNLRGTHGALDEARLLWLFSSFLTSVRGVLYVSTEANYRLRHPDSFPIG
jgi:hypothetical protein